MAKRLITDAGVYLAGYEFSGYSNQSQVTIDAPDVDVTTFGPGAWREYLAGLLAGAFSVGGISDPVAVEAVAWDKFADAGEIVTICDPNAAGGVSFFMRGVAGQFTTGLSLGQPGGFTLAGRTSIGPLVRGKAMHRATAAAPVTSTGTGTGQQLGAVASTKSVYAALHVFHVGGSTPSLTVKIQSDDNSGFTTPVDRLTFAAKNAIGAEWVSAGPAAITDTWWRAQWTVSGSSPQFGFIVSFGFI